MADGGHHENRMLLEDELGCHIMSSSVTQIAHNATASCCSLSPALSNDHEEVSQIPKRGCQMIKNFVANITVEPIMLLVVAAWQMQLTLTTNLMLDKVCEMKFNYSTDVCENLHNHTAKQSNVQRVANTYNMYQEVLSLLPSILFALFLGAWSDKNGRKLPMLLPFVGSFLASIWNLVNTIFWSFPPEYLILSGIPKGITGGFLVLLMACYSYICDITSLQSRTTRVALMDTSMIIGGPLGLYLSNFLFVRYGYTSVYTVSSCVFLACILYIILRIRETRGTPNTSSDALQSNREERKRLLLGTCGEIFNLEHARSTLRTALKPRENKGRTKLLLLMGTMCLLVFGFTAILAIDFLFTKAKFGWTYSQYMYLNIVREVLGGVCILLLLPFLSYTLHVDDTILGVFGCVSSIAGDLIKALGPLPWYLYLSAVVSSTRMMPSILSRSLISKQVPSEEVGQVFAVLASLESAAPIFASVTFTLVYNATVDVFPGACYVINSCLTALVALVFIWLLYLKKTQATANTYQTLDSGTLHDGDASSTFHYSA